MITLGLTLVNWRCNCRTSHGGTRRLGLAVIDQLGFTKHPSPPDLHARVEPTLLRRPVVTELLGTQLQEVAGPFLALRYTRD